MLSKVIGDFIKNANQLLQVQNLPLSQPIGFAEQWSEQGSGRRILVRPVSGKPAGPTFYGIAEFGGGTPTNQMVRRVYTTLEVQCWGLPDPDGDLLHNTDDAENLRQVVYNAINQAIPGGYRATREVWNHGDAQSGLYGRCLSIFFDLEQPIPEIAPYEKAVVLNRINMTAADETAVIEEA
jgi:hypothetical protein